MMEVSEDTKNSWRGQYTDPVTHQQRPVYGKTQAECKRKLDAKLTEIRSGSYVAPEKSPSAHGSIPGLIPSIGVL